MSIYRHSILDNSQPSQNFWTIVVFFWDPPGCEPRTSSEARVTKEEREGLHGNISSWCAPLPHQFTLRVWWDSMDTKQTNYSTIALAHWRELNNNIYKIIHIFSFIENLLETVAKSVAKAKITCLTKVAAANKDIRIFLFLFGGVVLGDRGETHLPSRLICLRGRSAKWMVVYTITVWRTTTYSNRTGSGGSCMCSVSVRCWVIKQ